VINHRAVTKEIDIDEGENMPVDLFINIVQDISDRLVSPVVSCKYWTNTLFVKGWEPLSEKEIEALDRINEKRRLAEEKKALTKKQASIRQLHVQAEKLGLKVVEKN